LNRLPTTGLAKAISHLVNPAGAAAIALCGLSRDPAAGPVAWLILCLGLYVAIPLAAIPLVRHRLTGLDPGPERRFTDIYDPAPEARQLLLTAGVSIYGLSAGLLWALEAPAPYLWAATTFLCAATVVWGVNRFWKISIHTTGAGGAAGLLMISGAPGWPLAIGLPLTVAWARWVRGAHNAAQVVSGALLGALVAFGCQVLTR